ncbi:helix-turn-helix transcriptional regulator [Brevundimonas naejangsanensis]|uniref:helix-turn-helix transcriptional regulator n=1 Tax=Brevundimonas naejangsanensis TaxID=588932 RepID=UPI0034D4789C
MAGRQRSDIDIEIGRRLRQARLRLSLTQEEVGAQIGVTHQMIQKYERGETRLTLSTLARLRSILRIEADDILPPLRDDGSAIPDPVAAMGQTIVGVHLANLFGRMTPAHQQNLLNVAKAIDSAAQATA